MCVLYVIAKCIREITRGGKVFGVHRLLKVKKEGGHGAIAWHEQMKKFNFGN